MKPRSGGTMQNVERGCVRASRRSVCIVGAAVNEMYVRIPHNEHV